MYISFRKRKHVVSGVPRRVAYAGRDVGIIFLNKNQRILNYVYSPIYRIIYHHYSPTTNYHPPPSSNHHPSRTTRHQVA